MTRLSDKLEAAMKAGTQEDIVLFLDFDGVISTPRAKHATGEWIDPIATALLAKLQREQGFQIVVSSTWRHMEQRCKDDPAGELRCMIQRNGLAITGLATSCATARPTTYMVHPCGNG